jgi:hypothetical protein
LKWRRTAETKITKWKRILHKWKDMISDFRDRVNKAELERDRAVAIISQIREQSEIKEQEYKLKIRKLQFDLNIIKNENESLCGAKRKIKRQVDL